MTTVDVVYEGSAGPWTVATATDEGAGRQIGVQLTQEHLEHAAEFAPLTHPSATPFRAYRPTEFGPLPGLLDDAMPDAWGLRLLMREIREHDVTSPSPLAMLSWLGRRAMGALTFRPVTGPDIPDVTMVELDRVQRDAARMLTDADHRLDRDVESLVHAAGSGPGGARPKLTVGELVDGRLVADAGALPAGATCWMVKFRAPNDAGDAGAVEAAFLTMARQAGLIVCDHRLLRGQSGAGYVAVRRFDRRTRATQPPERIHMASAAGLLEADHRSPGPIGATELLQLTRRITRHQGDVERTLRLIVFNVVAHNRDDHLRNVAYLWDRDGGWRLSPAYDLTWAEGPGGEHYLDVNGRGRDITLDDLRTLAAPAGLRTREVDGILEQTIEAVRCWPVIAERRVVSPTEIDRIERSLRATEPA